MTNKTRSRQKSKIRNVRAANSLNPEDAAYKDDLRLAMALSLSEAEEKEPKPNIHPNSRSAYALAKEEERMVKEAIEESIAEQKKPSAVLDREVVPFSELASSALPSAPFADDSDDGHELV